MKKQLFILACGCLLLGACGSSGNRKGDAQHNSADTSKGAPVITFDEMVHNFGNVIAGEKVEYSFKFTNTGNKDLLITDATSSCGCTVPDWPKEPLRPGKSAYMKVVFNSAGKDGFTEKEITINANTNPPVVQGPKIQCVVVKQ
ncbi:DUF1573 domain-containing protein [Chitinophaga sp. CF118]|uniref:DUF1573 domain-containing protein n=1 Tax=Chitinophaga sp. CF118 TaxID=1884367 RepID=UPI000B7D88ED|nr:DUF1573 domain-containing protein [Chitinophaga sp. CF118]